MKKFQIMVAVLLIVSLCACSKSNEQNLQESDLIQSSQTVSVTENTGNETEASVKQQETNDTENLEEKLIGIWTDESNRYNNYIFLKNGQYFRGAFPLYVENATTGSWTVDSNQITLTYYSGDPDSTFSVEFNPDGSITLDGEKILLNEEQVEFPMVYLINGTSFVDGVSIVQYEVYSDFQTANKKGWGLMYEDGHIVTLPLPEDYNGEIAPFAGGYAYANYSSGDDKKYMVFDKNGKITSQSFDDESSEVVCGGDGYYLIKIMERSIDVNRDIYGVVDPEGHWVIDSAVDFMYSEENGWGWMLDGGAKYSYLGDGYFCAHWTPQTMGRNTPLNVILNAKTGHLEDLYYNEDYESKILGVYKDLLIWEYTDTYGGNVYVSDGKGNTEEIGEVGFHSNLNYRDGIVHLEDEDGLNQYIDTAGNVIADYSGYTVASSFMDNNGRAAVAVYGKDGKTYLLGIIDNYTASTFDPINVVSVADINFSNGVVAVHLPNDPDNIVYVNVNGEILKEYPSDENSTNYWWGAYNGGFINRDNEYIYAVIE